jgi:lipopolysaccharide export system protein LptA
VALLVPTLLAAQPQGDETAPPASRAGSRPSGTLGVTADRMINRVVDGREILDLYGNVFIDRDTLTLRADTARVYRDTQVYRFRGRVRLRQQAALLTCARAEYRRTTGEGDFEDGVRVEEEGVIGTSARGESRRAGDLLRLIGEARLVTPEYTVFADTIIRDRVAEEGEASGRVKIVEPEAKTLVTGDHAVFSRDGGFAHVDRNPVLTSRERGRDRLEAWSREMLFFRDEERAVLVDSVRILQGRTEAASDSAFIFGRERLVLRGRPQVWIGAESRMYGTEIEFRYQDEGLERIILRGSALMEDTTPDSLARHFAGLPSLDVLEGDTIVVEISDDQVRRSTVLGNAHSIYVPTDLEDEVAFNDVRGDTIVIHFRDEEVRRVEVSGTMSGIYHFAQLAQLRRLGAAGAPARADSLGAAAPPDSVAAAGVPPDSVAAADGLPAPAAPDTAVTAAAPDTAAVYDFRGGAEQVEYSGGRVIFRLARRRIEVEREAKLTYGTMTLTAADVDFDTRKRELFAAGEPVLVDQDQTLTGDRMGYDFAYKTGVVGAGVTSFDKNYYTGKEIKRFQDGTLKINSGCMTSCDLERPHYHFWAHKMKIKLKDMVVAKPIVLKIGEVPVFALPFYFKSLKTGRRSGIHWPSFEFGWTDRDGRYIRDFGYYWATSDYLDFDWRGDYNERRDLRFSLTNRYVKRYAFNGGISYYRSLTLGDGPRQKEWRLNWNHRQDTLLDEYKLIAEVRLASRELTSNNPGSSALTTTPGEMKSNVRLSRSWSFMNANLSMSRNEFINADDDDPATDKPVYNMTLPSLSLGFRQITLKGQLKPGQRGSFLGDLLRSTDFGQSYSFNARRAQTELLETRDYDAGGSWSLGVRPPRLGIFNLATGVSGRASWSRKESSGLDFVETVVDTFFSADDTTTVERDVFAAVDEVEENRARSLSINSSIGTTLYGILPVRVGALQAIRHTLRFNVGHSYQPRLGDRQQRAQSFSFRLENNFDIKYLKGAGDDSTRETAKLDGVLNWSLATSYNPDRDFDPRREGDQRWQTISSAINIKPGRSQNLNLRMSNSIDPYARKILSTELRYGLNLRGRFDTGGVAEVEEERRSQALDLLAAADSSRAGPGAEGEGAVELEDDVRFPDELGGDRWADDDQMDEEFAGSSRPLGGPRGEQDETEGGRFIPWNLSSSFSYATRSGDREPRASGNLRLALQPTSNWEFSYDVGFDLNSGTLTRQNWSLSRDLHCWRLEFRRSIIGGRNQWGFRLYLIAIPAVEVPRGDRDLLGTARGLGSGLF